MQPAPMTHAVTVSHSPIPVAGGALEVHQIPAAQDNFVWLLVAPSAKLAAVVDGPDARGALQKCTELGVNLTTILNTHTHFDHIGINNDLGPRLEDMRVIGPRKAAADVPGLTEPVDDGDEFELFGVGVRVLLTEGHIDGHISFVVDGAVFCGDTLFAGGCGYLFDGPPQKMHHSLQTLSGLGEDTLVFCAHEYTQDNLRFAWSVEPDNRALADRIRTAWKTRAEGRATVPSTIGLERATNPFIRSASPTIVQAVKTAFPDKTFDSSAEVFAATRLLKDQKAYRTLTDEDLPL